MEVYEKINYLLKEKNISKKEFIKKLTDLEPRLKSTGEVPSESTIKGYLYGRREIKVELIPYIAEALGVEEQELFHFDIEYAGDYNYKKSKDVRQILQMLQYAPVNIIKHIKTQLSKYKKLYEETIKKI